MRRNFFVVVKGVLDPSTAQSRGQMRAYRVNIPVVTRARHRRSAPNSLTAIYAVTDNNGLFLGFGLRLLPEPVRLSMAS